MNKNYKLITATELKKQLGNYLDYVSEMNEVIISKNGKQIARISPYINDIMHYMKLREHAPSYDTGSKMISFEEFLEVKNKFEGRLEYINGKIVVQSSGTSFHQEAVGELFLLFKSFFKKKHCKVFLSPFDVTLYKENIKIPDVVQPDLLLACDFDKNITQAGKYIGIPTIVVEVLSPSTKSRDMIDKLNIYMLSGCKEYWVVDVEKMRVYQYGFRKREIEIYEIYYIEDTLVSIAFPEFIIEIKDIF